MIRLQSNLTLSNNEAIINNIFAQEAAMKQVPTSEKVPLANSSGDRREDRKIKCPDCDGGYYKRRGPAGIGAIIEECDTCGGTGKL